MDERIQKIENRLDGVETLLRETRDGVIKIATKIESPGILDGPVYAVKLSSHENRIAKNEKDISRLTFWAALAIGGLFVFQLLIGNRISESLFPSKPQPVAAVLSTNAPAFTASAGFNFPQMPR